MTAGSQEEMASKLRLEVGSLPFKTILQTLFGLTYFIYFHVGIANNFQLFPDYNNHSSVSNILNHLTDMLFIPLSRECTHDFQFDPHFLSISICSSQKTIPSLTVLVLVVSGHPSTR